MMLVASFTLRDSQGSDATARVAEALSAAGLSVQVRPVVGVGARLGLNPVSGVDDGHVSWSWCQC